MIALREIRVKSIIHAWEFNQFDPKEFFDSGSWELRHVLISEEFKEHFLHEGSIQDVRSALIWGIEVRGRDLTDSSVLNCFQRKVCLSLCHLYQLLVSIPNHKSSLLTKEPGRKNVFFMLGQYGRKRVEAEFMHSLSRWHLRIFDINKRPCHQEDRFFAYPY